MSLIFHLNFFKNVFHRILIIVFVRFVPVYVNGRIIKHISCRFSLSTTKWRTTITDFTFSTLLLTWSSYIFRGHPKCSFFFSFLTHYVGSNVSLFFFHTRLTGTVILDFLPIECGIWFNRLKLFVFRINYALVGIFFFFLISAKSKNIF